MKKILICLLVFSFKIISAHAQTGYAYAYAENSKTKTVYISYPLNTNKYSSCKESQHYTSRGYNQPPERCIENDFMQQLQIEAGSEYQKFLLKIYTSNDKYGYGNYKFMNIEDVSKAIKEEIANFRKVDYTVIRITL